MAGVKAGALTCVGWQVTLCDPIWQVTLRSSVMDFSIKNYTFLYLFFTFLLNAAARLIYDMRCADHKVAVLTCMSGFQQLLTY